MHLTCYHFFSDLRLWLTAILVIITTVAFFRLLLFIFFVLLFFLMTLFLCYVRFGFFISSFFVFYGLLDHQKLSLEFLPLFRPLCLLTLPLLFLAFEIFGSEAFFSLAFL